VLLGGLFLGLLPERPRPARGRALRVLLLELLQRLRRLGRLLQLLAVDEPDLTEGARRLLALRILVGELAVERDRALLLADLPVDRRQPPERLRGVLALREVRDEPFVGRDHVRGR